MRHPGPDPKQALVEQELLAWFENEVVDEALEGYRLTRVDLSGDRAHLTLWYLTPEEGPPDGGPVVEGSEGEPEAEAALAAHRRDVQDRVEEILRKRPEIRWREDRGAHNQRRVETILEELRGETGEDG